MSYSPQEIPNILIVDDRKENLVATKKVLKSIDAQIIEASSGNEALIKMLNNKFAVVLLDVQMPEMDGFEVATLMRENDNLKHIPIIFVTAINKEERYADQAAELGAVDYIFKPINSNILKSKVQVYVDLFLTTQKLEFLNRELVNNYEELERFAYICSHDLQEPARTVASFSELILSDYRESLDDKGIQYLDILYKNSLHMKQMIQDILTFSRIGRGEQKLEYVDCNIVLDNVLSEFSDYISDTQASINNNNLPVLQSNETLVHIVFQNLISNALKFHDNKNDINISINATENDDLWLFEFKDNGIGIDPVHSDKVFAVFQRIHTRDTYPGTGIGLSTCKKFVELYGGNMWFESRLNKGTSFFFTLLNNIEKQNESK